MFLPGSQPDVSRHEELLGLPSMSRGQGGAKGLGITCSLVEQATPYAEDTPEQCLASCSIWPCVYRSSEFSW